jgi:uncharacterized membrane protein
MQFGKTYYTGVAVGTIVAQLIFWGLFYKDPLRGIGTGIIAAIFIITAFIALNKWGKYWKNRSRT